MSNENEREAFQLDLERFQAISAKYRAWLGDVVSMFQTLELFLRVRLEQIPGARPMGITAYQDIFAYPVDTELPETEMTSYDSLGPLVTRYNSECQQRGYPEIDPTVVSLRDALAHGKVGGTKPSQHFA
jgi:hypothetical protein